VTQSAPILRALGGAVNASDGEQFDEFMASRWPGLVRLAFGLTGDRWLAEDLAQTALASAYAAWWRVRRADDPAPSYAPPTFGNPAFLTMIPGFPGVSAVFTQLPPRATKLTATFLNGTWLAVRPVWVSACGQRFHLDGFLFADSRRAVTQLISGTSNEQFFASSGQGGGSPAGLWTNFDGSRADLRAGTSGLIGQGTTNGAYWTIMEGLGLAGQCYIVRARAKGTAGRDQQCLPIALPPSVAALGPVPFPDGIGGLSGYAGLVSPHAAKVIVTLSAAPALTVRPVNVAGRAYVAFAVPPGCQVTRMRLFDSAGRLLASTTKVPPQ
jgi:hypothetical protein